MPSLPRDSPAVPSGVVVVKVGGSLLDLPDLPRRLTDWLAGCRFSRVLLVAGGGAAADAVRQWDRTFGLEAEAAHQLAVGAMGLTAQLLARLLPGAAIAADRATAEAVWSRGCPVVLDVPEFLSTAESLAVVPLPHSWEATSDSIAAWVARVWPAAAIVLLKSAQFPGGERHTGGLVPVPREELPRLADTGLVDAALSGLITPELPLFWHCLRHPPDDSVFRRAARAGPLPRPLHPDP